MIQAKLYVALQRLTLGDDNWVNVVNFVKGIKGVNGQPANHNHGRGNLDTFVHTDSETYSNTYIFEARFPEDTVDFQRFKDKLVNEFGIDETLVTYTTGTQTIKNIPSCFATYRYNAINRIRVGLFGWTDDNTPPNGDEFEKWVASREEAKQYIIDNSVDWEV